MPRLGNFKLDRRALSTCTPPVDAVSADLYWGKRNRLALGCQADAAELLEAGDACAVPTALSKADMGDEDVAMAAGRAPLRAPAPAGSDTASGFARAAAGHGHLL